MLAKMITIFLVATTSLGALAESTISSAPEDTQASISSATSELKEPQVPGTEKKAAALSEAEIPVQLETVKKQGAEGSSLFKALAGLATVGLLCCGAYLMLGKYRRSQVGKSSAPEIKVLRQHYLGPKKSLAIIRVAGESLLIGVTDSNISMIKSLALLDEDVPEEAPQSFLSVFQKENEQINEGSQIQSNSGSDHTHSQTTEQEDFSIAGIRDFVSNRLKSMRSIE